MYFCFKTAGHEKGKEGIVFKLFFIVRIIPSKTALHVAAKSKEMITSHVVTSVFCSIMKKIQGFSVSS